MDKEKLTGEDGIFAEVVSRLDAISEQLQNLDICLDVDFPSRTNEPKEISSEKLNKGLLSICRGYGVFVGNVSDVVRDIWHDIKEEG